MKFTIDIKKLESDINKLKQNVHQGILDGFANSELFLINRMQIYMEINVYKAYISASESEEKYQRTNKLMESVKAEIIDNALYIYSDSSVAPYNERVLKGNDVIPYDFPWVPRGSTGDFRVARDFVEPTRQEIINHFNQDGELKQIIISAIRKRIG